MSSNFVTELMMRNMQEIASDMGNRVASVFHKYGEQYGFDANEALKELGLSVKATTSRKEKRSVTTEKRSNPEGRSFTGVYPLPYNGEYNDECCKALRWNAGLFTQCRSLPKNGDYCKTCENGADRNEGVPEYGTIDMRKYQDMLSYVDPKGRKQVAYSKVMSKFNLTKEESLEEAGKQGITIDERHFEEVEVVAEAKKAPKAGKVAKEPTSTGKKGRPKKAETVVDLENDGEEVVDLFSALVLEANTTENTKKVKKAKIIVAEEEVVSEDNEEAQAAKAAVEKALKKKAKKEEAEKKAAEEEAAKKKAAEEEAAKKKAAAAKKKAEEEKAAAAKKKAEEASAAASKKAPVVAKAGSDDEEEEEEESDEEEDEEEEEEERVTKITFNGVKYLKSSISGAIYDYTAYTENEEQVVVGRWDETNNKVIFKTEGENDEEEEEEYEEEE